MIQVKQILTCGLLIWPTLSAPTAKCHWSNCAKKVRTVVTTDMEQDDLTSLVRYLLYTPDLDTQGIIYSASRFHWEGDYKGTTFFLPGREYTTPQTSFRWTGNTTIQDIIIPAYAEVYDNLKIHDPGYPSPDQLLAITKIGNVDFEGEYDHDTDGSNLIKSLLLDNDPRPLFVQAWGGTNTIARALKSIEEDNEANELWPQLKTRISDKTIIMASGFQDETYAEYISVAWPDLQVRSAGVSWTGYNCNFNNTGNVRGLRNETGVSEDDNVYFTGAWIHANIETGPYGKLYRSWLDGQHMAGDQLDVFGNTTAFPIPSTEWCPPLGPYDFLGEGDDGTYFPLLPSGIEVPENPTLGGWGGRAERNESVAANLWESVIEERAPNGTLVADYGTNRFISAMQNDFAARMQWTKVSNFSAANHPPHIEVSGDARRIAASNSTLEIFAVAHDPDGDDIKLEWWQYVEEGSYNGTVSISTSGETTAVVHIPADARSGQTISVILQGTDDGIFPLTRYARVIIQVR